MANGSNQNTNQPSRMFGQGQDFSGSLNDMLAPNSQYQQMLAPYQQMAQRFQSPYATMNQNSWLAQNHPQVAGMLDNAFLTAGMTPQAQGPEGVGGGISRMMQGLMGGQQFQRQRMMQQAMMPYQMLSQSLQPMDVMSQIQERHGAAIRAEAYGEAMANRYGPGGIAEQQLMINQQRADQAKYGRVLSDPMERMAHDVHPFKDPQNPTIEEQRTVQEEYMKMKERAERQPAGSWEEQIFKMQQSPEPAIQEMGNRAHQSHLETLRAGSGARASGEQPYKDIESEKRDTQRFIEDEGRDRSDDLQRHLSTQGEWERSMTMADPTFGLGTKPEDISKQYDAAMKPIQDRITERDKLYEKWRASDYPKQRIGFKTVLGDPNKYPLDRPTATPPPSSVSTPAPTTGITSGQWLPKGYTPKQ